MRRSQISLLALSLAVMLPVGGCVVAPPPPPPPPGPVAEAPPPPDAGPPPEEAAPSGDVTAPEPPPPLPVYDQPPISAPGYMWTPGYWGYAPAGYYWVPGVWVEPPSVGLLWTPPWWGFAGGVYGFHTGYWGPHIGFYGGINYGFGYGGVGFEGGYWDHGAFRYNRAVNNFGSVHITNFYNRTVINNGMHTAFNGGAGGIGARPTPGELAAEHEHHFAATSQQASHQRLASTNRSLFAAQNHGRPPIAATSRPGELTGRGAVPAREGGMAGAERGSSLHPTAEPHETGHAAEPEGMGHAAEPHATAPESGGHNLGEPHPAAKPHPAAQPRPAASRPASSGEHPETRQAPPRPANAGNARPQAAPHPAERPRAAPERRAPAGRPKDEKRPQ